MATFLTRFSIVDRNIRGEGRPGSFALISTLQLRDEAFAFKFQGLDANCGIVVPPFFDICAGNSSSKEGLF